MTSTEGGNQAVPEPQLVLDPRLQGIGSWIRSQKLSDDQAGELQTIVHGVQSRLEEAAIGLFLYGSAARARREDPRSWKHRAQATVGAKAFMYSASQIRNLVVRATAALPALASATAAFDVLLPDLAPARNSAAHSEERMLGLRTGGKTIDIKPLVNVPGIEANPEAKVLISDGFFNDMYTSTAADGSVSRLPITFDAFVAIKQLSQALIDQIPWWEPGRASSNRAR